MIIARNIEIKALKKEYQIKKNMLANCTNASNSLALRLELNAILQKILELAK